MSAIINSSIKEAKYMKVPKEKKTSLQWQSKKQSKIGKVTQNIKLTEILHRGHVEIGDEKGKRNNMLLASKSDNHKDECYNRSMGNSEYIENSKKRACFHWLQMEGSLIVYESWSSNSVAISRKWWFLDKYL